MRHTNRFYYYLVYCCCRLDVLYSSIFLFWENKPTQNPEKLKVNPEIPLNVEIRHYSHALFTALHESTWNYIFCQFFHICKNGYMSDHRRPQGVHNRKEFGNLCIRGTGVTWRAVEWSLLKPLDAREGTSLMTGVSVRSPTPRASPMMLKTWYKRQLHFNLGGINGGHWGSWSDPVDRFLLGVGDSEDSSMSSTSQSV